MPNNPPPPSCSRAGMDLSPFPMYDEEWAAVHHPNRLSRQGWDELGVPSPPHPYTPPLPRLSAYGGDGGPFRANAWHG